MVVADADLLFGVLGALSAIWLTLALASSAVFWIWMFRTPNPRDWRLNIHAAHALPGRASFYPREGRGAVVVSAWYPLPVVWRVQHTESGTKRDLSTVYRGPPLRAARHAHTLMAGGN